MSRSTYHLGPYTPHSALLVLDISISRHLGIHFYLHLQYSNIFYLFIQNLSNSVGQDQPHSRLSSLPHPFGITASYRGIVPLTGPQNLHFFIILSLLFRKESLCSCLCLSGKPITFHSLSTSVSSLS